MDQAKRMEIVVHSEEQIKRVQRKNAAITALKKERILHQENSFT